MKIFGPGDDPRSSHDSSRRYHQRQNRANFLERLGNLLVVGVLLGGLAGLVIIALYMIGAV